jgi:hypothetical protein
LDGKNKKDEKARMYVGMVLVAKFTEEDEELD